MEEQQITLQIDHHFITVPAGTTLLEAAAQFENLGELVRLSLKTWGN